MRIVTTFFIFLSAYACFWQHPLANKFGKVSQEAAMEYNARLTIKKKNS